MKKFFMSAVAVTIVSAIVLVQCSNPSATKKPQLAFQVDATSKPILNDSTVFNITVTNSGTADATVSATMDTLSPFPVGWTANFCAGGASGNCYFMFQPVPDHTVAPGSSLEITLHIYSSATTHDTAQIRVVVSEKNDPAQRYENTFTGLKAR